ncbi:DUF7373 family lipoprotein [Nocardia transvalensis]|uniref:DUF7373 family lipoprotein n=1 Tax=Nocardia transvalensis TaxID=37333 RepID=UPI0018945833|nr:hypothetical protein [Nocardia transvalensis]MBF6330441.1 hypothetical protein [Nocardia transvalensis]
MATVLLAGCSSTTAGNGQPAEIDVRTLETGNFPTTTPRLETRLDRTGYLRLEAARMAAAVRSPYLVDAKYSVGASASTHVDSRSVAQYLDVSAVPILTKYGFIVGFSTASADDVMPLDKATRNTHGREGLAVTVLRFPDVASAKSAAIEIDGADFAAHSENVAVRLPNYPGSVAHWRPSVPTLGSTTAHGIYVVSILADSRAPDLSRLVEITQHYLDVELPELDRFLPTPVDMLEDLPRDPDRLLARTLHNSGVVPPPDGQGEVVYSLPGYLNYILDQAGRYPVLERAGVDRVSVTPTVFVFRTRDASAAERFVGDSTALGDPATHSPVDPPEGVPSSVCVRDLTARDEGEFRCFVAYGRYAALVLGHRLWETQQRAAAQYALLANSL